MTDAEATARDLRWEAADYRQNASDYRREAADLRAGADRFTLGQSGADLKVAAMLERDARKADAKATERDREADALEAS